MQLIIAEGNTDIDHHLASFSPFQLAPVCPYYYLHRLIISLDFFLSSLLFSPSRLLHCLELFKGAKSHVNATGELHAICSFIEVTYAACYFEVQLM